MKSFKDILLEEVQTGGWLVSPTNQLVNVGFTGHADWLYAHEKLEFEEAIAQNWIRLSMYRGELAIDSKDLDDNTLRRVKDAVEDIGVTKGNITWHHMKGSKLIANPQEPLHASIEQLWNSRFITQLAASPDMY